MTQDKTAKKLLIIPITAKIQDTEAPKSLFTKRKIPLRHFLFSVDRLSNNLNNTIVLLKIDRIHDMGWSVLQSMRRCLLSLNSPTNHVIAHIDAGGLKEYYLASLADEIILSPMGYLDLIGLQADSFFLKDALNRAGLDADFVKTGDYKTYADMFIRNSMSDSHRQMLDRILKSYMEDITEDIASTRSSLKDTIDKIMDDGPFSAEEAIKHSLVDSLKYSEGLEDYLKEKFSLKKIKKDRLHISDKTKSGWNIFKRTKEIALIYATGQITESEGTGLPKTKESIAPNPFIKAIRTARNKKSVKAIVLRVNSPGGSALSSDILWNELVKARDKKPVVISMSNVAASGGYYIAMGASSIFIENMGITGSIGVVVGKIYNKGLLEKLGIGHDSVSSGKMAGFHSLMSPFTEDQKRKLESQVFDFYYRQFLQKASEGRNKDYQDMEGLAGGRVWTGRDAISHGLVDKKGGWLEAVHEAKALANIKDSDKLAYLILPKKRFSISPAALMRNNLPPFSREILDIIAHQSLYVPGAPLYLMPEFLKIKG